MRKTYSFGAKQATQRPAAKPRLFERRGTPATGRIVRLLVGQGHGFIRLSDEREVVLPSCRPSGGHLHQ